MPISKEDQAWVTLVRQGMAILQDCENELDFGFDDPRCLTALILAWVREHRKIATGTNSTFFHDPHMGDSEAAEVRQKALLDQLEYGLFQSTQNEDNTPAIPLALLASVAGGLWE